MNLALPTQTPRPEGAGRLFSAKHTRIALIVAAILVAPAYLVLPVIMGACGIGDRLGPRMYPESLHDALYMAGWTLAGERDGKPRVFVGARSEYRPWFYGLPSRNNDPEYIRQFLRKQNTPPTTGPEDGP